MAPPPPQGPQAGASAPGAPRPLPTLIVNPVQAAAGYDSAHIVYQREPNRQERFAYNEWVDTPARMLAPPLMAALSASGAFRAVVPTPSAAAGDLRLDVEIVQLVQDFTVRPSSVRLALHAYVVDDTSRRVLAWRDIKAQAVARSDDPAGGAAAANLAVRQALTELAKFSVQVARDWRPGGSLATIPR
jgi:cholesterol transport system auxiliary component